MKPADEEAPFSEQILRWLDEGDKLAEAPDAARAASGGGAPVSRGMSRGLLTRDRTLILGAAVIGVVVVGVLRLVLASHGPEVAAEKPAEPPPRAAVAQAAPERVNSAVPSVTFDMPTITVRHNPAAATAAAVPPPAASSTTATPAPAVAAAPPSPPTPVAPAPAAAPVPPPAVPVAAMRIPAATPAPAVAPVAAAAPATAPTPVVLGPKPLPVAAPAPKPAPPATAAPAAVAAAAGGTDRFASDVASCRASLRSGKIKTAIAACQSALDARANAAEPLALMAEAEYTRGRGREALRLANAAIASDPGCADAYVIIGGVQQDLGHKEEAFAAYRRYLNISPRGSHASELRALLASR